MRLYEGRPNDVYPRLIADILQGGDKIHVRGLDTLELHPVCLQLDLSEPLITSYGRPVNVAFALVEILWILQGRRDVEMLAFYNESIRQFSDTGETFNAPYGYRLRHAHGYDQLYDVVATLRDDPQSRQAVLTLWHPNDSGWFHRIDNPDDPPELLKRVTADRACNYSAHVMIRDGALDWVHNVRSNDAILGVPMNFMQFGHLQAYLAAQLGIKPGRFWYIADSMHLYLSGYYDETKSQGIEEFDLYRHLPALPPADWSEDNLRRTYEYEEKVRAGGNPVGKGEYWEECVYLFEAHRFYKQGNDRYALRSLSWAPPIYSAAQHRFYWAMRWGKDTFDSREYFRAFITDSFPAVVAAWITV